MFRNLICAVILATVIPFSKGFCAESDGFKEEVNIYHQVYDAPLVLAGGKSVGLLALAENKPLIIASIFKRCSNVCYPLLLRLKESLQFDIKSKDYRVLVISFDPADKLEDMEKLAASFGIDENPNWAIAITPEIDALNRTLGFDPVWDEARQQFDHDALLVGVNTDGYITRKLIGIRNSRDIEKLIAGINNVFTPSYRIPGQSLLFSCFNYNPETGKSTPGTGLLFIAMPAVLAFVLLVGISSSVRKKNQK